MEEIIKDFYNRIVGYIEVKPNGDKIGKDFYRRIVGYYDKQRDITQDFYRRIYAHGDALAALVMQSKRD